MSAVHPLALCRAMGIDVLVLPVEPKVGSRLDTRLRVWARRIRRYSVAGEAPGSAEAMISPKGRKGFVLAWYSHKAGGPRPYWPDIVHEALHLVLGPHSLVTEVPMFPVESELWALTASRYGREWLRMVKDDVAIGHSSGDFTADIDYAAHGPGRSEAVELGWMSENGRLLLRGAHPGWRSYLEHNLDARV